MLKYPEITIDNFSKQYFISATSYMKEFLTILTPYNINHFSHTRIYADKSKCLITTHPNFSELFMRRKFYTTIFHGSPASYLKSVTFLKEASSHTGSEIEKVAIESSGFGQLLVFTKPGEAYTDFWHFGAAADNSKIPSFYYTHLDLLENFVTYFQERGNSFLKKIYHNRFYYPGTQGDQSLLVSDQCRDIDLHSHLAYPIPTFPKTIHSGKDIFDIAKTNKFTLTELKCAMYLTKGYCPKEIAKVMYCSVRTVEKHLEQLKHKMCSRSLIHLMSQLLT